MSDELRAAGDALADEVTAMLTGPVPDSGDWWPRLAPKVDAWRSVRGDAPTQPPADAEARVVFHDAGVTRYHADGSREVLFEMPAASAVARTDGQPPADELARELKFLRKSNTTFERIVDRAFNAIPDDVEAEDDDLATYIRAVIARGEGETTALHGELSDVLGEVRALLDGPDEAVRDRARAALRKRIGGAAPDDEADGLTAEQYRHIYDDLIRGLAVDLGLDPEKADGGSVTAAVRRLVAGVSVPQKSTESPDGDTAAPDGGAS